MSVEHCCVFLLCRKLWLLATNVTVLLTLWSRICHIFFLAGSGAVLHTRIFSSDDTQFWYRKICL